MYASPRVKAALVLSALVLGAGTVQGQVFTHQDSVQILASYDTWMRAFDGVSTPRAILSVLADDPELMPPHHELVWGQDNVMMYLVTRIRPSVFRSSRRDLSGSGDWAVITGTYFESQSAAPGNPTTTDHGNFILVLHREALDHWGVVYEMWASERPGG